MWGVKDPEAHVNVCIGPRDSPRKNPSLAMERIILSMDVAEDKGDNLPLVVTLQIVPWNRKSIKVEKNNEESESVWGEGCHYGNALSLT